MSTAVKQVEVRERPILFSGEMIRAIIGNRKTQTRRVVKGNPIDIVRFIGRDDQSTGEFGWCSHERVISKHVRCHYGWIGDRLWVRETFAPCFGGPLDPMNPTLYRADAIEGYDKLTWKPSIFMPRWASRITLEIKDVRVERLQEIDVDDICREGVEYMGFKPEESVIDGYLHLSDQRRAKEFFANGWDKINGKRKGCDWASNPFVWVVEFERL